MKQSDWQEFIEALKYASVPVIILTVMTAGMYIWYYLPF